MYETAQQHVKRARAVRPRLALSVIPFALVAIMAGMWLLPATRPAALWLLAENHPVALLTFALLAAGGGLALRLAWRLRPQTAERWPCIAFAILGSSLLLIALKEVAWGQQSIGFHTAQSVAAINTQVETALPNILYFSNYLDVFLLLFGVLGFAAVRLSHGPHGRELRPIFGLLTTLSLVNLVQNFAVMHVVLDGLLNALDGLAELLVAAAAFAFVWRRANWYGMVWRGRRLRGWLGARPWPQTLFYGLLTGDFIFIGLHLIYTFSNLLAQAGFSLEREGGYAEQYQYVKLLAIVLMLALIWHQRRSPLDLTWVLLVSFLLLDDARALHEAGGAWLANLFHFRAPFGLRPRDVGELLLALGLGSVVLLTLSVTYRRSGRSAQRFGQILLLPLGLLIFCAVVLDAIHGMATEGSLWGEVLAVLEDGGELVSASLMAWVVAIEATPTLTAVRRGELLVSWRSWLATTGAGAAVFAICFGLLAAVQVATPGLVGNDGYYHAKIGYLMRQEGLTPAFTALPHTILNAADYYDHHLLYHIYLSFFAKVDPAVDGGIATIAAVKLATVLLTALAFTAVWWLLRQQRVPWASLWTLGLFALSEDFLFRLSMPRTQAASLLVLLLGLHWLLQRRYRPLLPLAFAYVWLFDGFPLLFVVAIAFMLAVWVTERQRPWRALLYPALGSALGLFFNPYFPKNVIFTVSHILPKLGAPTVLLGDEWYPYAWPDFLHQAGVPLALLLLSVAFLLALRQRPDTRTLAVLLVTLVFGGLLLKARRFVEYFPPFALLLLAFTLAPWWQTRPRPLQRWLPLAFLLLALWPLAATLRAARDTVAEEPAAPYAAAALWLKVYSTPNSTIFQTDWDDFPQLFFYNSTPIYTLGLDPTYMVLFDAERYDAWEQVTDGQVAQPSAVIRERFRADYVFSDWDHTEFLEAAVADPGLVPVYKDEQAVIFEVVR